MSAYEPPAGSMDRNFLIIDGYNLIYRAFFALANSSGKTTSVSVFFSSMLSLMKAANADLIAVCMDSKGPTLRKAAFSEYKANRDKTPPQLHDEIDVIREILSAFRIPVLSQAGYEADDLICALQRKYAGHARMRIASGDKDLLQLVNDEKDVQQFRNSAKDDMWMLYDEAKVAEKYGVPPRLMDTYLALLGDSSDNVPGVLGIGEKSAKALVSEYGDLDAIYSSLDSMSPSIKRKLSSGKEDAYVSFRLVSLRNSEYAFNLEGDSLEDYSITRLDVASGAKALERAGCLRIASQFKKRMLDLGLDARKTVFEAPENGQSDDGGAPEARKAPEIHEINLDGAEELMKSRGRVAILLNRNGNKAFICDGGQKTWMTDLSSQSSKARFREILMRFCSKSVTINAKRLYGLADAGKQDASGLMDDVNLESYLLDSSVAMQTVFSLARIHLGENLNLDRSDQSASLFDNNDEDEDRQDSLLSSAILSIHDELRRKLSLEKLSDAYETIEKPLVPIVSEMERAGILVDAKRIRTIESKLKQDISELESVIFKKIGREFNLQSPKQLQDVLSNDLKVPLTKKTRTGFSTDQETLEQLAGDYEVIALILEHRSKMKILGTYTSSLLDYVSESDGRLHTSFSQTGTQTGRFSSANPNLQNIPARTREGRMIRSCFVAGEGKRLISCDYSQIELRVLAHLSKDKQLTEFFNKDQDAHRATAAALKGVDYDSQSITEEDRSNAKTINFAVIYGMSAFTLAKILKTGNKEAQAFIDGYFDTFKGVVELKNRILEEARATGWVSTEFGRRRHLPDVMNPNKTIRQRAERQALNSVIQGEAADIMKIAILKTHSAIKLSGLDAKLLLTVHDEIICECDGSQTNNAKSLVKREMESAVGLSVPLKANVSDGDNWGDL